MAYPPPSASIDLTGQIALVAGRRLDRPEALNDTTKIIRKERP